MSAGALPTGIACAEGGAPPFNRLLARDLLCVHKQSES